MSKRSRTSQEKRGLRTSPEALAPEPPAEPEDSAMRLQKFLARAGVASRRGAEVLIEEGRITINGKVADKLGTKVDPAVDVVEVDGKIVSFNTPQVTLMLNKPAGYVTTMADPQGRPCVAVLVPLDQYPSLFPVGRLDRDTSGLLLFSTDGELGNGLLHPSRKVDKTYYALVDGKPSMSALGLLRDGLPLDDGMTAPAKVQVLEGDAREKALAEIGSIHEEGVSGVAQRHGGKASREQLEAEATLLSITIHEGRNRQVRRMCSAVGHPVIALHRHRFGPLEVGQLPRGSWQILTEDQVSALHACVLG